MQAITNTVSIMPFKKQKGIIAAGMTMSAVAYDETLTKVVARLLKKPIKSIVGARMAAYNFAVSNRDEAKAYPQVLFAVNSSALPHPYFGRFENGQLVFLEGRPEAGRFYQMYSEI